MFYIRKYPKQKDAIRISCAEDIPSELEGTVRIENGMLKLLSAEGYTEAPLGQVIGIDRKAPTETGYGAWPLREGSYTEKDGKFYPSKDICEAEPVEPPFSVETSYGTMTLKQGERGLLITTSYGTKRLLTLGTSSAEDYMICDKDGSEIAPLSRIDEFT